MTHKQELLTPAEQINLMLPTRFIHMCPGRPGQLRHFRVIAADWADAWQVIQQLYHEFVSSKYPCEDLVMLAIPAKRLIPDDYSFYLQHRGPNPLHWEPVELIPDEEPPGGS
jgi:hypothetical protein